MIKHTQEYDRLAIVDFDDVMAAISETYLKIQRREKPSKFSFNGVPVNVKSLRLQTFYLKGPVCVACGRRGTHFALERAVHDKKDKPYHLNLWATDANGDEYLMTHDHILARSLGGRDVLENTQTMCSPCNAAKAIEETRLLREQRDQEEFTLGMIAKGVTK